MGLFTLAVLREWDTEVGHPPLEASVCHSPQPAVMGPDRIRPQGVQRTSRVALEPTLRMETSGHYRLPCVVEIDRPHSFLPVKASPRPE